MITVCAVCGKEFNVKPAKLKIGRGKYCSRECYLIKQRSQKTVLKKCPVCGKEFKKSDKPKNIYCSRECSNKAKEIDITGQKFNRLTPIKQVGKGKGGIKWLCKCDCGNETILSQYLIKSGMVKSCGCLLYENDHTKTHQLSKTKLYRVWQAIKRRCFNKNCKDYKDYGGRGVTICQEWLNDFMNFYNWAMISGYKEDLSIDRIDVNGNYCPENCRWVSMIVQQNNKRNSKFVTYNNQTHTISDWGRILGIKASILYQRLKKGWSIERAFTTPPKNKC